MAHTPLWLVMGVVSCMLLFDLTEALELDALEAFDMEHVTPVHRRQTLEEARLERLSLRSLQERFANSRHDESMVQWIHETSPDGNFFDAAKYRRTRKFRELATTDTCSLPDLCAPHGFCMEDLGCSCFENAVDGHWRGTTCDECVFGYAGENCTTECAGGSCNPCNSNGQCSQGTTGDGVCTCYSDASRGFWGNADCSTCADNYYGAECKNGCPGVESGLICSGRGFCNGGSQTADGKCVCEDGYDSDTACDTCDLAHYGDDCQYTCDGYVAGSSPQPCNGHGSCSSGYDGDGSCTCLPGWAGETCALHCPNGGNCGGNGTCHDGIFGNGTCTCFDNYAAPNCSSCLPEYAGAYCNVSCTGMRTLSTDEICSGRGTCVSTNQLDASCACASGYQGRFCQLSCLGEPPCSGHGQCVLETSTTVACQCSTGWSGSALLCETCAAAYANSASCSVLCPTDTSGNVCSNRGTCLEGVCYCSDLLRCGAACNQFDSCSYCSTEFRYGPSCTLCPGVGPPEATVTGAFTYACNNNGLCSHGTTGSGACTCFFGFAGSACELTCPNATVPNIGVRVCSGIARGTCSAVNNSFAACACRTGFAGTACQLTCPTFAGEVCGGHGHCDAITGACSCSLEWTGPSCQVPCLCNKLHGQCSGTACASYQSTEYCATCLCQGNFTDLCYSCRNGTQGINCEGECVDGVTVGTLCNCSQYVGTTSCNVRCPFGVQGNESVVCSGRGNCSDGRLGDGLCHCSTNYYGLACEAYCLVSDCSIRLTNAQCNPTTGACECQDDFAGHWQIGAAGQCDVCSDGYWGPACTELCSCNNHGTCDQNTGECQCYAESSKGYFSGTACDACAVGYIGESCTTSSVLLSQLSRNVYFYNGSTVASTTFFGPSSAPAHVTPRTRVLLVDDGPTLRHVVMGGLPVVLLDATNTSGSGDFLVAGASSDNPSTINSQFAQCGESVWAWKHRTLLLFLLQPSSACSVNARIVVAPSIPLRNASWGQTTTAWSLSAPTSPWFRIRAAAAQSDTSVPSDTKLYSPLNRVVFVVANATFDTITGTTLWSPGGFVVFVDLGTDSVGAVVATAQWSVALPDTFHAEDIAISPYAAQQRIAVSGSHTDGSWDILWFTLGTTAPATLPSVQQSGVCWPPFPTATGVATSGTSTQSCLYCGEASRIQLLSFDTLVVAIRAIDAATATNDTLLAWIGPRAITAVDVSAACATSTMAAYVSRSLSGNSRPTALAVDFYAQMIFVAAQLLDGEPSIMTKFLLLPTTQSEHALTASKLLLNGVHNFVSIFKDAQTNEAEIIAALVVAPSTRLMYVTTNYVAQIRLTTFLLYEIVALEPQITSIVGTQLTIIGRGFQDSIHGGGNPMCFFGTGVDVDYTPAEIVNATMARCYVANMSSTDASCDGQVVELSLFNPHFGATTDLLSIQRAKIPTLTSVFPARGNFSTRTVTISGVDFVNSTYAQCRFSRRVGSNNIVQAVYAPATFITPSEMSCTQPTVSVTNYTFLDLTLDRQVYSLTTVPYVILGPSAGILPSLTAIELYADAQYVSFSVTIATVDDTGNPLDELDVQLRSVVLPVDIQDYTSPTIPACSSSEMLQWRRQGDGYPFPPCRDIVINQQPRSASEPAAVNAAYAIANTTYNGGVAFNTTSQQGRATFSGLYLYEPRAGAVLLTFVAAQTLWTTQVVVTVQAGAPHALLIKNRPQFEGTNPITIPSKAGTPLPDVIIVVVDRFANVVEDESAWDIEVVASVFFFPFNCSYTAPNETDIIPNDCMGFEGSFSATFSRSSGTVPFSDRIVLSGSVHGARHFILFNSTSYQSELIPVVSPYILTAPCAATQYKVPLTTECRDCPTPGGSCDGSETIDVSVGYWRAPNVSTFIYECDKLSLVCNGSEDIRGSQCISGAVGPLCSNCITNVTVDENGVATYVYYGKSRVTDCELCEDQVINDLIFATLAIGVFVVVVIWSFCTLRTEQQTDVSVVLRTVVNHLQATGELGQLSTRVGPFLKGIFSVSGGASTISIRAVQFLECFQKQHQFQFEHFFYGIMCLPVLALPVAYSVFGVIRLLKLTPMLSAELSKEVALQEAQLGPNGAFVGLKRKYPLFMVFTTTFCVIIFTVYQTLIAQATSVLLCTKLVMSESYLSTASYSYKWFLNDDMSIECSANGISPLFLPGQLFAISYGFGIPLTFIFGYRFINGRLGMPALTSMIFMFLSGGYKKKFWFWQALIMIRKLMLVLVRVFIEDEQVQSAAGMWIMSVALVLQLWLKPNEKDEHNQVEAGSLAVITLTLNLGLIYFWPNLSSSGEVALNIILVVVTFSGMVMLLVYLIPAALTTLKEIGADIRSAVAGIKKDEKKARERRKKEKLRRSMLLNRLPNDVLDASDGGSEADLDASCVTFTTSGGHGSQSRSRRLAGSPHGGDFHRHADGGATLLEYDFEEIDPRMLTFGTGNQANEEEDDEEMKEHKATF